ncbi:MAG TPA: bifunctional nicotinamidase/pyrazinamidase [Kofleriaceae bacterium]|jgi:nicotinamidase/pyrazinamidase
MRALILVDLQYDFCPGGALGVPDGDKTIAVANRVIPHFQHVVATQDWHPRTHASFSANNPGTKVGEVIQLDGAPQVMWPVHCVQETDGAKLHAGIVGTLEGIVQKGTDSSIDSYSGFFDNGHKKQTQLHQWLQDRWIKQVYVMGLATDYCVKFTVLDALKLGYDVKLIEDGCYAVNLSPGDGERAIAEMRTAGAGIVESGAIGA